MSVSSEFRHCIRPLVIFNSICGTGLLEYYNDYKTNVIGYIYSVLSISVYLAFFYGNTRLWDSYKATKRPLIVRITFQVHNWSFFVFYVYTMVFGILRKKKMTNVLSQLESCMRAMEELGIPRNYSKYHRYMWYLILSSFIILFIMGVLDFLWSFPFINNYGLAIVSCIVEHYPFIVLSTGDISFLYWISYIKLKFGELNTVIRDMLTTSIDSPQHKRVLRMMNSRKDVSPSHEIHQAYRTNSDIKKIRKIKQTHLELIKCAKIANTTYGWHILMSMTTAFVLLTTLLYNVYNLVFEIFSQKKIDYLSFGYWIFYFSTKIVILSHACSATIAEIRDFTQQLIQNPLAFTACGFFSLDHTFIRGVIGTVTTYLVILIQVGNSPLKYFTGNETLMEENI